MACSGVRESLDIRGMSNQNTLGQIACVTNVVLNDVGRYAVDGVRLGYQPQLDTPGLSSNRAFRYIATAFFSGYATMPSTEVSRRGCVAGRRDPSS